MNKPQSKPKSYGLIKTRDIFHIAYLLASGMQVKEIVLDENTRREQVVFILVGENIGEIEKEYRSGKVTVNLFTFKEWVTRVKDMMYDHKRAHTSTPYRPENGKGLSASSSHNY